MNKTVVPIAMASDNNYAMPMAVAMTSILENLNKDCFCEFIILIPTEFSDFNKEKILKLQSKYCCKVIFIDMKNYFKDAPNQLSHATIQSYYRLLLADIIQDYAKVIYLDVDIVVLEDISPLINMEINDNYFAGVVHPTYFFMDGDHHCKLLNIPNLHNYINAGVLVVNLAQIREDKITNIFIDAVEKDYPTIDQDVINSAAHGRIFKLDFKYNVLVKCSEFLKNSQIESLYNYNDFADAFINPVIVHFADKVKPWKDQSLLFAAEWSKYFKLSPYSDITLESRPQHFDNIIPEISVVMATRNRGKYISYAIDSILKQSYTNFEFIIVDDASSDETPYLTNYYALTDKRIRVIRNERKLGISGARNKAYEFARGKYIAVMDDDDESLPERFRLEYDFLENNKSITVVGTDVLINKENEDSVFFESWISAFTDEEIKFMFPIVNSICHSSTMIRKSFLEKHNIKYNEDLLSCVDFDLWSQIAQNNGQFANIPQVLQEYRVHFNNITIKKDTKINQDLNEKKIRKYFFSKYFSNRCDVEFVFGNVFEKLSREDSLYYLRELNQQYNFFSKTTIDVCIARELGIPYPYTEKNLIPIVFASDNNYAPFLSVAMISLVMNGSESDNYQFIVLEKNISLLNKQKIKKHFQYINNVNICFVNVTKLTEGMEFKTNAYYTESTYYRIAAQSILRFFSKVLYIDVDTVVLNNVRELFDVDVSGYLMAASLNAGTIPHAINNWKLRGVDWGDYLKHTLGLKNIYNYFQAGVLVLNIPEMTKFDVQGKSLEKLKTIKPVLVDQDILNFVCEGRVKKISLQWDFLDAFRVAWKTDGHIRYLEKNDAEDYVKAQYEPYIVHYAGENLRPWLNPKIDYAELWWKYARLSPYYEEIIYNNLTHCSNASHSNSSGAKNTSDSNSHDYYIENQLLWREVKNFKSSISWKITYPLRKLYDIFLWGLHSFRR